jgi:hypothetical protein
MAVLDGPITQGELLSMLAGSETSNSKQRLRNQGLIEIATASEAKPVGEISADEF